MKSQQSFGTFRGARELENAWATTSQPENLKKMDASRTMAKMLQTTEKWEKSRQKSFKKMSRFWIDLLLIETSRIGKS